MMGKLNVNGALKLLTNDMSNGILPLDNKILKPLNQNHHKSCELNEDIFLSGEKPLAHPVIFEDIDENMIQISTMKTEGGIWSFWIRRR